MSLTHENINTGDRIYVDKLDQICVIKYKDSKSILLDPVLPPKLPLRLFPTDGKYEGLKSWHDFVVAERIFKNYTP